MRPERFHFLGQLPPILLKKILQKLEWKEFLYFYLTCRGGHKMLDQLRCSEEPLAARNIPYKIKMHDHADGFNITLINENNQYTSDQSRFSSKEEDVFDQFCLGKSWLRFEKITIASHEYSSRKPFWDHLVERMISAMENHKLSCNRLVITYIQPNPNLFNTLKPEIFVSNRSDCSMIEVFRNGSCKKIKLSEPIVHSVHDIVCRMEDAFINCNTIFMCFILRVSNIMGNIVDFMMTRNDLNPVKSLTIIFFNATIFSLESVQTGPFVSIEDVVRTIEHSRGDRIYTFKKLTKVIGAGKAIALVTRRMDSLSEKIWLEYCLCENQAEEEQFLSTPFNERKISVSMFS